MSDVVGRPLIFDLLRSTRRGRVVLGAAIVLVFGGMLYAGLKPFRLEANCVGWMTDGHGVRIGSRGIILSQGAFGSAASGRTIEMWIEAAGDQGGTIVSLYDRGQSRFFSVSQDWNDFVVHVMPTTAWSAAKESKLYAANMLFRKRSSFWSVAADRSGTAVYRDGKTVVRAGQFRISEEEFGGLVVLGTAPIHDNGWTGVIRGLAIFDDALSAARVEQHYESWRRNGSPQIEAADRCSGLYLFDEASGNTVRNRCASGPVLHVPVKYRLLYPTTLDPVWRAFRWSKGFWEDAAINYFGFIPLSFLLCAWFSAYGVRRPEFAAATVGSALSLFIELVQTQLPSRDSSMSDLIMNAAGSMSGAALCRKSVWITIDGWASHRPLPGKWLQRTGQWLTGGSARRDPLDQTLARRERS